MLGFRIRAYLDAKGIKYTKVAADIGVTPPVFTSILSGNRSIKAEEYASICKSVDVPLDYFFDTTT